MDRQFGGRSNPSTWQNPGVGMMQYYTGQPMLNTAVHYSQGPQHADCARLLPPYKYFFSHDPWVCSEVYANVQVPENMQRFYDPCGCGVTLKARPKEQICTAEQRSAECDSKFAPVCGINNLDNQRISYVNACSACQNPKITSYSQGGC